MPKIKIVNLIIAILVCQAAGLVGSLFTAPAIPNWYAGLNKPSLRPPNWLFAPIWTTLYALMGVSLFLVWQKKKGKEAKQALTFFFIQLVLNSLWSIIFFGLRSPQWALIEIVVLWLFILLTMIKFYRLSKPAGWLFLPYLLWVTFAVILNFNIVRLN